jgi:hypothetical protein
LLIWFYVLGNRVQHTLAALGKQEESKNVEILEENHGRERTVLTGHLPGEWSATLKLEGSHVNFRVARDTAGAA